MGTQAHSEGQPCEAAGRKWHLAGPPRRDTLIWGPASRTVGTRLRCLSHSARGALYHSPRKLTQELSPACKEKGDLEEPQGLGVEAPASFSNKDLGISSSDQGVLVGDEAGSAGPDEG